MMRIQRRIGLLFASIGLAVTIANLITFSIHDGFIAALLNIKVNSVLFFSLLLAATGFIRFRISRWIQTLVPFLVATIAVFDTYDSVYGLGMFAIGIIIGLKHGLFIRYFRIKVAVVLIYIFAIVIAAAEITQPENVLAKGIDAVLYLLLFGALLGIIYSDEIKRYAAFSSRQTAYIKRLKSEMQSMQENQQALDLDSRGITPAEKRIIQALVEYGGSNAELSERLGISPSTVKAHLASIFDKLGVENRWGVIDLCRYNQWEP